MKTRKLSPKRYGWIPDRPDFRDFSYNSLAVPRDFPSKVDLSSTCSPVENQGRLGSCTANAIVSLLEFLQKKDSGNYADLSRLFLYYNERLIEGWENEDSGAYLRDGIKSLTNEGICLEKTWPYQVTKFKLKPSKRSYDEASKRKIVSYYRIRSLQDMKACLASGYPFVFGFSVYENFESREVATSGNLALPQPSERMLGGHAVLCVGYDDATEKLLIKNSWGTNWGVKGYFTMPYGYVTNRDLSDDFWTIRK